MLDLGTLALHLVVDDSKLNAGLARSRRHTSGFASDLSKVGAAATVGFAAAGAAAFGVGKSILSSVDKASKFDASMRMVGATTGETGGKLASLTALAQKMGAETSFSAQGASDAMLALAKGGMTAAQMKAGALKQTLTLATAGGLQLGDAAGYMVQGLSAFGLKAKDASRVAVALAGGANASTASVESMGLALSQVGAQAKTAGLSIEDTTAALAAFDNAGVKGQDAGTSLKTFLQRLVPTTLAAQNAMERYGLVQVDVAKASEFLRSKGIRPLSNDQGVLNGQLKDYAMKLAGTKSFTTEAAKTYLKLGTETGAMSNAFFDASGNIKSMSQVAQVLQDALKGQTKEQKIAALTTLFGSDASRAAAILAEDGAKGLEKFMKATRDKSAADKLAKTATEGYAGALERFKGSVETAQIQFGSKLLPVLSKGLNLLSGRFLPAMMTLGSTVGPIFSAFGHIASETFKGFFAGADKGRSTFKRFTDYISVHQGDIVGGLVAGAKAALGLGKAIAGGSSVGLRAIALLSDAQTGMTTLMLAGLSAILHGMAETWGFIPGIGPKLKAADAAFATFSKNAVGGMKKIGPGARAAADVIDKNVVPAIDKAQGSLDKIGKTEIAKAKLRDSAARAAQAIANIGTDADGSQVKIKHFNDITDLAADKQKAIRGRLNDARTALRQQIDAMQDAGVGQGRLTKAWETGKDRLYKEFLQMGLSKAEAKRLAAQYAGIKPKVRTDITQPGMTAAQTKAKNYRGNIRDIPTKWNTTASLTFKNNAGQIVTNLNKSFQLVKGGPKLSYATGGVMPGYTPGRDVHQFHSPTGGSLALSGGEAIMRPEWTRAVGGPRAVDRMNKAARSGQAFAYGGVYGAGQRATSREGDSGSQMYGWAVKKKLEGAMKYAKDHGTVRGGGYAKALDYAKAHVGHPYVFASLWDCSGFMSSLQSIILGQQPHRRYSTPAFHGDSAQGFTRDKKSAFMVGVRPLAGKLGHMAGTLNGVNVESAGGVGVRVGKSARGYNNGMFSWRGGMADGGVIGDLPFDLLDPRGERYDPRLRQQMLGYSSGTMSARAGINGVAEGGGSELVVNPQFRKFKGGEQVLNNRDTKQLFADAEKGSKEWKGSPLIGEYHEHHPASMDPRTAAAVSGSMVVSKLRALGVG